MTQIGSVLYTKNAKGELNAHWSLQTSEQVTTGTGIGIPVDASPDDFDGRYTITYTATTGDQATFDLTITKTGSAHELQWFLEGALKYVGSGIQQNNQLVAGWHPAATEASHTRIIEPTAGVIPLTEAMQLLSASNSEYLLLYPHGTLRIEIYQPAKVDRQTPHEQDEVYVVISGSGNFVRDGITAPFTAGDVIFVPAGMEHRFENFTDNFATWVIFYGKKGGEPATPQDA